jgi:hypothetical protein
MPLQITPASRSPDSLQNCTLWSPSTPPSITVEWLSTWMTDKTFLIVYYESMKRKLI